MKRGCNPEKIIIHRYGIDLKKFNYLKRKFDNDRIIFLTVGRFVEKKGIEYSLKALAKLPDKIHWEYRIVGEGDLLNNYKNIIEENNIKSNVKFLGPKTKSGVIQEMKSADIFVLTSITAQDGDSEGLPVALIEAHAMGLPLFISTYNSGIPELVNHEKTGLLSKEKDVNSIAENILRLASEKNIRKYFGENAVERIKDEFDINKLNDTLFSLLEWKRKTNEREDEFKHLLANKNWSYKEKLYADQIDNYSVNEVVNRPNISVIVISWRLHPDNIKSFQVLEKQRDQNFELIFVNNGADDKESNH